jgi:hypothetical protein
MQISPEIELAPYIKSWRTSYEENIQKFWCRYSQQAKKLYCDIDKSDTI